MSSRKESKSSVKKSETANIKNMSSSINSKTEKLKNDVK